MYVYNSNIVKKNVLIIEEYFSNLRFNFRSQKQLIQTVNCQKIFLTKNLDVDQVEMKYIFWKKSHIYNLVKRKSNI